MSSLGLQMLGREGGEERKGEERRHRRRGENGEKFGSF